MRWTQTLRRTSPSCATSSITSCARKLPCIHTHHLHHMTTLHRPLLHNCKPTTSFLSTSCVRCRRSRRTSHHHMSLWRTPPQLRMKLRCSPFIEVSLCNSRRTYLLHPTPSLAPVMALFLHVRIFKISGRELREQSGGWVAKWNCFPLQRIMWPQWHPVC